jgi:methyl-accepting chemotaxis protein
MFNKLTIKAKLLLSFSFVAIIAAIIGYVGYTGMNQIHNSLNNVSKNTLPSINSLWIVNEAQTSLKAQEFGIGNDKMSSNVKDIEVFINRADKTWINIGNALKVYDALPQGDQEAIFWKDFLPKWKIWESDDKKVLELAKQKRDILAKNSNDNLAINKINSEIEEAVKTSRLHFGAAEDALGKVLDENIKISEKNAKEAEDASAKSTQLLIIFIVVGVIFAIVLGYFIAISIKKITDAILKEINTIVSSVINGNLSVRGKSEEINFEFRDIMINTNNLIDAFVKPINVTAEYVDRISKGDLPPKIVDEYKGDFNEIKTNLNLAIDSIQALIDDAAMLVKAAVAGKLSTRADVNRHQGDFREIVQGVNDTLDAVIGPLNVAAEYVDRISKGDMPPVIVDNYNGDFNEIKTNLNQAILSINALVADANMLAKAAVEGKLSTRAKADKHQGDFRAIVEGVNNTLDSVIGPLNVAAEYVDRISKGDMPPVIVDNYNGDFNEIKTNLNQAIASINALVSDANMLSIAAVEGKLSTRADASKHQGDFRAIVEGVNNTLDSVINPLNVAADYVDKISKGDIPEVITDSYNGDFNTIKNNLNRAINAINLLVSDANMLAKAAVEGKLSTRAKADKHQGDFRAIVEGVNNTLDSVIGPLNVAAEYVDRISKGDMPPIIVDNYNGDFNEIKTNLNQAIIAINALVADASLLAQAGVEGKLQTRADASKHQGDFRKIVDGVNNTLDSVIGPLNAANEVLAEMAGGNLAVSIDANYNGDLDTLKQSINNLAFSLRDMIKQISDGVETTASTSYQMSTNADSLASASQEQAAQADEVASAVEEMSRTVTENAMSAGRTAEVAQKNGEIAKEGGSVVEQTITKMRDIATVVMNSAKNIQKLGESSKEIGEIVSVIDDIADQTNLLALNAAIEAARAGEQGRGFAVVADEVRKLAERTTAATKQIASMIKGIQQETEGAVIAMNQGSQEVQNGISLADRAGDSLSEVVSSSQEVLDMINQIVVASEEQSATSEQISKNVMSISKVTGESTERIEQIAHASEDLTRLTESLKEIVSQFRIDDGKNNSNLISNRKSVSSNRNGKQLVSGR